MSTEKKRKLIDGKAIGMRCFGNGFPYVEFRHPDGRHTTERQRCCISDCSLDTEGKGCIEQTKEGMCELGLDDNIKTEQKKTTQRWRVQINKETT